MARFWLSAVGADRPGIVAALSEALVGVGGNLADSTMAVLQDQFAVLLLVSAPDPVTAEDLDAALTPVADRFELVVSVRAVPAAGRGGDAVPAAPTGEAWVVAIHGADRPGIVHAVTAALAAAGGNVVDLATHLVGDAADPVYVMTLRATLPAGAAGERAASDVRAAAGSLGVHCSVHRDDADLL